MNYQIYFIYIFFITNYSQLEVTVLRRYILIKCPLNYKWQSIVSCIFVLFWLRLSLLKHQLRANCQESKQVHKLGHVFIMRQPRTIEPSENLINTLISRKIKTHLICEKAIALSAAVKLVNSILRNEKWAEYKTAWKK